MISTFEKLSATVLNRITPTRREKKKILSLAEVLAEKVRVAAEKAGIKVEVRLEGSVAKDTWLREEPDIDIFMRVPMSIGREAFKSVCLEIAKEATRDFKQVERFAEHPYLEVFVNSTRVNIVPCYYVKKGEWISATDRTPFHTDYMKSKLNDPLRSEIRLLKRFMKGIGVYGAEIKVGGFSGYLSELLILNYGSFTNVLKAAACLKNSWLIDYEGYYKGREDEIEKLFPDPLVVVDPVDKGRNVASALRRERLVEFVAASREFLVKPSLEFFYPRKISAFTYQQFIDEIKKRGSVFVFVRFGRVKVVPDVLWGQLYKTQRSLLRMLDQNDFHVLRGSVWSNEQDLNVFIFELEHAMLPQVKKHLGPPIRRRAECNSFLKKHVDSPSTISGPYIEGDRWVVEIRRKYTSAVGLLSEKLKGGGRHVGVADFISQAIKETVEILVNEEILSLCSLNPEFARFLTQYLKGKPSWLK